jgi:hypothetical protein
MTEEQIGKLMREMIEEAAKFRKVPTENCIRVSTMLQNAANYMNELRVERDEARAEVERLKDHIPAATKMIRPEPSRLEIAAMFMARPEWGYTAGQALKVADLLIAAAKGGAE